MGEARTCVILLFVLVQFRFIHTQSFFDSFICDFLCGEDGFGLCDDCSSEESSESIKSSTNKPASLAPTPSQNISIKIPASQGTILGILNVNGLWSVSVDAQNSPSGLSVPPGGSTTAKPSAASESTTAGSTTAAARR